MIFSLKQAVNMMGVSYPSYNFKLVNGQCKYCVTKLLQHVNLQSCRSLSSYSSHTDYYAILGVSKSASADEIKAAFVKQSKKLHPDKNPSIKSHSQFVKLNEAYSTLKSPDSRKTYDMKMGLGGIGGEGAAPYGFHGPNSSGPLYYEFYNSQTGQTEWTAYRNANAYNDAAWQSHVNRRQREDSFRQNFDRSKRRWGGFSVHEEIDRGGGSDFNRHIVSTYLTMFLLLFVLTMNKKRETRPPRPSSEEVKNANRVILGIMFLVVVCYGFARLQMAKYFHVQAASRESEYRGGSSYLTRSSKYRKLDYDRLMLLETQSRYVDIDMKQEARRKSRSNSNVCSTNIDSETR